MTLGYDLHFDDTDGIFSSHFRLDHLTGIAPQMGRATETIITGGDVSGTTVPTNRYITTVTLTALQDIPPGTTIRISDRTRMGDAVAFERDPLDVSDAVITFASEVVSDEQGPLTLHVDTLIDTDDAKVNNDELTLLPVASGDAVRVEFFAPAAAGSQTIGYDFHFDDTDYAFSDNFRLKSVVGLVPQLGVTATNITGGSVSGVVIPPGGYLATVTMTALRDIPKGTVISLSPMSTMADAITFERNTFDVSGAVLTFVGLAPGRAAFESLKLRVDTRVELGAANDANVNDGELTLLPVASGETVRLEFFVSATAGTQTIGYDFHFVDTDYVFSDNFRLDHSWLCWPPAQPRERSALHPSPGRSPGFWKPPSAREYGSRLPVCDSIP